MAVSASIDTSRAAALFHALADQIRVDVVMLLLGGERCVCELMADLGLAQSRLSWHLKALCDVGIISGRRNGRWIYYSLNADALVEARGLLDVMKPSKRALPTRSACCD
jgi:ArsR family transcriptional regulator